MGEELRGFECAGWIPVNDIHPRPEAGAHPLQQIHPWRILVSHGPRAYLPNLVGALGTHDIATHADGRTEHSTDGS